MAIPPVAATTPSLKFSVALIIPDLYAKSRPKSVPKVRPTAVITMPGYRAFEHGRDAAQHQPFQQAVERRGHRDHCLLKMVMSATTNPPRAPPRTQTGRDLEFAR